MRGEGRSSPDEYLSHVRYAHMSTYPVLKRTFGTIFILFIKNLRIDSIWKLPKVTARTQWSWSCTKLS